LRGIGATDRLWVKEHKLGPCAFLQLSPVHDRSMSAARLVIAATPSWRPNARLLRAQFLSRWRPNPASQKKERCAPASEGVIAASSRLRMRARFKTAAHGALGITAQARTHRPSGGFWQPETPARVRGG
jgi:hypothetical protein